MTMLDRPVRVDWDGQPVVTAQVVLVDTNGMIVTGNVLNGGQLHQVDTFAAKTGSGEVVLVCYLRPVPTMPVPPMLVSLLMSA